MQRSMVPARRVLMRAVALTFTVATVAAAQVVIAPKPGVPQAAAVTPPKLAGAGADGQIVNVRAPAGLPWRLGTTVSIAWDWPGFDGRQADVTLWKTTPQGPVLAATLVSAWTQRQASWIVPATTAAGQYAVKVASTGNPQNSAVLAIQIDYTTVTLTSPKRDQLWMPGTTQTIAWTFQGKPDRLVFEYALAAPGERSRSLGGAPGGQGGAGSMAITVPTDVPDGLYTIYVSGYNNPAVMPSAVAGVLIAKPLRITNPPAKSSYVAADEYGRCRVALRWKYLTSLDVGDFVGVYILRTGDTMGPGGKGANFAHLPIGTTGFGTYDLYVMKGYTGFYDLGIASEQHPEYQDKIPVTLDCR